LTVIGGFCTAPEPTAVFALHAVAISRRLDRDVLIFWLLGITPWVLLLTWAVSFYLTFIEARQQRLDALRTLWWMLLVFFTHFLGYVALRAWVFYKRHATV
jgi:hypothetical protein